MPTKQKNINIGSYKYIFPPSSMNKNYDFVYAKKNTTITELPFFILEIQNDNCSPDLYHFTPFFIDTGLLDESNPTISPSCPLEGVLNYLSGRTSSFLIQYKETGDFGYFQNGKDHLFENQREMEMDVYHFFYMYYSHSPEN